MDLSHKLSKRQLTLLYEEVLYTILHRVGQVEQNHVTDSDELYEYVQKAFSIDPEEHQIILQRVKELERPIFCLKATVKQARNILGKDVSGLSDPYCLLGIERKKQGSSAHGSPHQENKRRSKGVVKNLLPEDQTHRTQVIHQTLNPVWDETFILEFEDIENAEFQLDMWDFDAVEPVRQKLEELTDLRGLKRIIKDARKNKGQDDFLGNVVIRLQDLHCREDRWYRLEPRTDTYPNRGHCHLQFLLVHKKRATSASKTQTNYTVHRQLLQQIVSYEILQYQLFSEVKTQIWFEAQALPSVEITGRLRAKFQDCWQHFVGWRVKQICWYYPVSTRYSKRHFGFPPRLGTAELEDSFQSLLNYGISLLQRFRIVFPLSSPKSTQRLQSLLRVLVQMCKMKAFKELCTPTPDLEEMVIEALKAGTAEWFYMKKQHLKPMVKNMEECGKALVCLLLEVNADLQECHKTWNKYFIRQVPEGNFAFIPSFGQLVANCFFRCLSASQSFNFLVVFLVANYENSASNSENAGSGTMRLDLFSIAYLKMQELVSRYVKEQLSKIDSGMSQLTAESLFQLYLSMKELYRMKDFVCSRDTPLALTGFHLWFKEAIPLWLQKTYTIALERTQRAIQVDQLTPLGDLNKHSTSIVDLSTCYAQMVKTWQQLDWPDPEEAFMIMVKFVEDTCKLALMYCQMIKGRAEALSSNQNDAGQAANRLCVVVNNIEQLRMMILKLPNQLNWASLEQNAGPVITPEQIQHTLHHQLQASISCLNNEIRRVVQTLGIKMDARIAQHIQELSVCSDTDNPEDCITPLMRFLMYELQYLNMNLVQENFNSLLELLWNHTLDLLKDATKHQVGKLDYFKKFQFALQEEATPEKYGAVTIKAFYRHSEQKLYVEVLNAVNLLPMDSNGLSDPFIQLTLEPHHDFPEIATRTTECIKNNLHPLFDEDFEFLVPPEKCQQEGACLLLTVFDYDTLGKNDLEGEAFLPLCRVLGLNEPEESINPSRVPQIRLSLTHPGTAGNDILKLLGTRKGDKEAQAFVKLRRQRAKYSKELA
ncbi:hypothetical protein Chor_012105 [Crotalus horridus]